MIKDIKHPESTGVGIAILPEPEGVWRVHFLNNRQEKISGILVNASAEGMSGEETVRTATMRYFLNELSPGESKPFELIHDDTAGLEHRFWVSFHTGQGLADRRFILLPGDLNMQHVKDIPGLGQGIWLE